MKRSNLTFYAGSHAGEKGHIERQLHLHVGTRELTDRAEHDRSGASSLPRGLACALSLMVVGIGVGVASLPGNLVLGSAIGLVGCVGAYVCARG